MNDDTDDTPALATAFYLRDRALGVLLIITGGIGFLAAFVLMIEKIELLKDPSYVPTCSINPILSCGSIMKTSQAELFGFPNPLIGVAAFPAVILLGVVLVGGASLPRWIWAGLQAGVTLALVFIGWLAFQSLYDIDALCPYCMVVWAMVIPLFWYVTLRNAHRGVLGQGVARSGVLRWFGFWHVLVLLSVFLVIFGLILHRFWFYWSTLL